MSRYGAEKVYICCGYTDIRQGIDGLSALVKLEFNLDPFSNTLLLFCGWRCTLREAFAPTNQTHVGTPKTEKGTRKIPSIGMLREYLEPIGAGAAYIIGGDAPIMEMTFKRTYQRIAKTTDLHGATPHVFRHSCLNCAANCGDGHQDAADHCRARRYPDHDEPVCPSAK